MKFGIVEFNKNLVKFDRLTSFLLRSALELYNVATVQP